MRSRRPEGARRALRGGAGEGGRRPVLELGARERCRGGSRGLQGILGGVEAPGVLLDNIEILFEPSLRQDPLRCLQAAARNRSVVTAWGGMVADGWLTYAAP